MRLSDDFTHGITTSKLPVTFDRWHLLSEARTSSGSLNRNIYINHMKKAQKTFGKFPKEEDVCLSVTKAYFALNDHADVRRVYVYIYERAV